MLKIAVVTTSIREGRVGLDVANWALNYANSRNDKGVSYELVDLADFDLPVLGAASTTETQQADIGRWIEKMGEFDGYVFAVAEYNHAVTGAIKNATDYLKEGFYNKAAAFVGYGGLGGIRAIENFRVILAELQVATVQKTVNFLLATDFENYTKFAPNSYHLDGAKIMLDQLTNWAGALKTIR